MNVPLPGPHWDFSSVSRFSYLNHKYLTRKHILVITARSKLVTWEFSGGHKSLMKFLNCGNARGHPLIVITISIEYLLHFNIVCWRCVVLCGRGMTVGCRYRVHQSRESLNGPLMCQIAFQSCVISCMVKWCYNDTRYELYFNVKSPVLVYGNEYQI